MDIRIQIFGAFRKFFPENFATISLKENPTIATLKAAMLKKLSGSECDKTLMETSVIAINDEIAPEEYVIKNGDIVAILPPVCGG